MAHIKFVYDSKARCESRVRPDFDRVVNVDENGDEHVTFVMTDYPKLQKSLGSFKVWSLQALIDAGIDPDFGIRTGFNTRAEAEGVISSAVGAIGNVVDSDKSE